MSLIESECISNTFNIDGLKKIDSPINHTYLQLVYNFSGPINHFLHGFICHELHTFQYIGFYENSQIYIIIKAPRKNAIKDPLFFNACARKFNDPPHIPTIYELPKNQWKDAILYYKSKNVVIEHINTI